MSHPYIPFTDNDAKEMLSVIGLETIDDLFSTIPQDIQEQAKRGFLALPEALTEQEVSFSLQKLSLKNAASSYSSFLGAGAYRHFIPAVIDQLLLRGEFLTSYTPYQPEISQGTLQAIFEFQTSTCRLTEMEVSNAGLYDGATALVEAVSMALRLSSSSSKNVVIVSKALSSSIKDSLKTALKWNRDLVIEEAFFCEKSGGIDIDNLDRIFKKYQGRVSSVVAGYPNYFGVFEDLEKVVELANSNSALTISYTSEALSFALFKTPGSFGVDICCGDFQSFGVSLSFGGPYCGFLATREKFIRQLPGRVASETLDCSGKRGFVLALSTREQHIRREKATSNICTNNQLLCLAVSIYLALHGPKGLKDLALTNCKRRIYLEKKLKEIGLSAKFSGVRFNEVVIDFSELMEKKNLKNVKELVSKLFRDNKILIGPSLEAEDELLLNSIILCVTELNSIEDIDSLVACLKF